MKLNEVLIELEKLADPEVRKIKARFAITAENDRGIFLKDLEALAKRIGPNDDLALQLFDAGVYEARLLTSMLYNPKNLTDELMEKWVRAFVNWEICDTFCMGFFGKSRYAVAKALRWSGYEPEYQKRAGFVCMVSYAFTDKYAINDEIRQFFPIIKREANDERKYVMKGVNWALRQIGKRNPDLHNEAIEVAHDILAMGTKPARWIAKDALRQLQSPKVFLKNYPRALYGNVN